MKQFKIDVSKCTDDEKRQIQERLFEMGYKSSTNHNIMDYDYWYAREDGIIDSWNHGTNFKSINKNNRPASDFLTRFQTRPHDYTGCHPDIAAALKRGEEIYCEHTNGEGWIFAYDSDDRNYCYTNANGYCGWELMALPIPAAPEMKSVTLELTDEQLEKIKGILNE